jgi:hypothetical protein
MDELIKRVEMGAIPVLPGASVLTPRMERLLMKPCSPLPTVVMRIDPCSRHVGDVDVEKAFASLDVKTAAQRDDCMEKARLAPFKTDFQAARWVRCSCTVTVIRHFRWRRLLNVGHSQ